MKRPILTCAAVAAATWDGWRWYASRIAAAPEEALSLMLGAAFLAAVGLTRAGRGRDTGDRRGRDDTTEAAPPHLLLAGLLAAYAALRATAPPIFPAAVAVATTLYCVWRAWLADRPPPAFWGLVALTLPVLPSMQFTLGYPMRIVSASLTVGLLRVQGFAIERQGTFLAWQGEMVQFDAPCSGVNMLWASLLLTTMGGVLLRLGWLRLAAAMLAAVAVTVGANVLRAASLFYVEAGLLGATPHWWHEGAGLAAFVVATGPIAWVLVRLQPTETVR